MNEPKSCIENPKLANVKIGDQVQIIPETSFGDRHLALVTDITTRYYEDTGNPYQIIWCEKHGFDMKSGGALTPPTMYYIDVIS